jgi:hypothetical protein
MHWPSTWLCASLQVGEGMTFRFRLQLADEELVALTAARAVQRATAGPDGLGGPPGWSSSSGAATPNTAASVMEPGEWTMPETATHLLVQRCFSESTKGFQRGGCTLPSGHTCVL